MIKTKLLFLLGFLFLLINCKEEEPVIMEAPVLVPAPTPDIPKVDIAGYVQKGPFINGTSIVIVELNDSLGATGKTFFSQVVDNKGSFSASNIELSSSYIQLVADGFYFDEVKGEKSAAQLTLFALADTASAYQINVNVLSHLEKDRVLYLVGNGMTFTEAKKQAQQEILSIFGIVKEDMGSAESLDISQQGEDNAILLAISAILQGDSSVAELSELLAEITSDLREDGKLDSEALKSQLKQNAIGLKLSSIRQNVQERYRELGVEATIPSFEQYIDSDGDAILNKEEDDTPEDFVFETQQHVTINTTISSNEVIITGILEEGITMATISNGQLIKNGELLADTLIQIKKDDKLKIQLTSSSSYNTAVTASLTVGTLTKSFEVVTDDYSPDEFSIPNIESAMKDTDYTTSTVTITGIQHPTPVTIDNGIIIKNGVAISTDSTTVVEGDQLAIKMHSHPQWANTVTAHLQVGSTAKDIQLVNKNNRWTKKAVFPGAAAFGQVSFAINGKIYVGTGSYSEINDFYEYDPAKDKWIRKADFPGTRRMNAVGFSLRGKGYIGLGYNLEGGISPYLKDFWEYDPVKDKWTRISDFPGAARAGSSNFIINDKAYIGFGSSYDFVLDISTSYKDFWEYNPADREWVYKSSFPGEAREGAVGFSVENTGFIVTGYLKSIGNKEVWKFNPSTDQWAKMKDFPGGPDIDGMSFTVNGRAYFGMGDDRGSGKDNFWEYDATSDIWFFLDGFNCQRGACGVSLQNKGYYIKGLEIWEYTP